MTDYQTPTPPTTPDPQTRPPGLAGLRAMSTTAGVTGLGEYRAVNPLAVVAAVLAVACLGVVLHPGFLLAAALAVLLGVVATVQIARSHGTQTGLPLAVLAAVVGLAVGGYFGYQMSAEQSGAAADEAAARGVAEEFGKHLTDNDFESAHALLAPALRDRLPADLFARAVATVPRRVNPATGRPLYGDFAGASLGPRVVVGDDTAAAEFVVRFDTGRDVRQGVVLVRTGDGWRIESLSDWFPAPR